MAAAPHWVTVSAASVLGVGMLATSAIGVASAMPLVDTTTSAEVPPITTAALDGKGTIGSDYVTFPIATSSPAPASSSAPASAPASSPTVERAPAPAPQPVAPRPAAPSGDSVDSPDSPDVDDDDDDD
jgi:hypothetical protein